MFKFKIGQEVQTKDGRVGVIVCLSKEGNTEALYGVDYGAGTNGFFESALEPAADPSALDAALAQPATITATERATGKQVELLSSVPVHYGRYIDAKGQPLVVIDGIVIGTCEEVGAACAALTSPHSTA